MKMMLDNGKKSYFDQSIALSGQQNDSLDSDDDDNYFNSLSSYSKNVEIFESLDGKISLGFDLAHGKEGIIVHLIHYLSIDKGDQVYVDVDLKFTFIKTDETPGVYSFDFKKEIMLSYETGFVEHLMIPYSKTPFNEDEKLLEEYRNDFDNVTIQCKGYYSLSMISKPLKGIMDKKEKKLSGALPMMLQSGLFSDLVLVAAASGKEFSVHKNILAAYSPVFASLFSTDVMVKEENRLLVIDMDTTTLELILKFIYNDITFLDYLTRPLEMMKAAIKYEMAELQNVLEEILCLYMEQVNPEQVRKLHVFAFENDFDRLSEESLRVYVQNLTQKKKMFFNEEEEKESLSIEAVLLKSENLQFDDFQGRIYSFTGFQDKYYVNGFTKKYSLSFEKNYLVMKGQRFSGFKWTPSENRLDILKCLNYDKELVLFKNKFLCLIFADTTKLKTVIVLLCGNRRSVTSEFYNHLMARVEVLRPSGNSNKNQLYDCVRGNIKMSFF